MESIDSPQTALSPLANAPAAANGEIGLLLTVAQYMRGNGERSRSTSQLAEDAIEQYCDDMTQTQAAAAMRLAILDHLATLRGFPEEAWMVLQPRMVRAQEPRACPHCKWKSRPFMVWFESGHQRTTLSCPRCLNVIDAPATEERYILVAWPLVHLVGDPPSRDWSGAIYAVPGRSSDTRHWRWPDKGPAAATTVDLSRIDLPSGPLWIRCNFIEGTALSSFGGVARRP